MLSLSVSLMLELVSLFLLKVYFVIKGSPGMIFPGSVSPEFSESKDAESYLIQWAWESSNALHRCASWPL